MKQKGVATAAIAAIVVVVVVVAVAAVVLLLPGGLVGVGTTGIAAMPGSTARGDVGGVSGTSFLSSMTGMGGSTTVSAASLAGISMDIYSTSSSATEVVNHYKSKWSGEGYTENICASVDFSEYPGASAMGLSGSYGVAIYQKGDQMVGVVAVSYQNEAYYILMAASKSTLETLAAAYGGGTTNGGGTAQPPTSDVSGSDISDIPRYTGSVRSYYGELYGVTNIYYVTSASTSTVADFYATQLPANGWTAGGTTSIYATKGSAIAAIEIKASTTYSGYTEIQIAYYSG